MCVEVSADLKGAAHPSRLLAYTDGQHSPNTGLPGTAQHLFAVIGIALAVQVGVGINQQSEPR